MLPYHFVVLLFFYPSSLPLLLLLPILLLFLIMGGGGGLNKLASLYYLSHLTTLLNRITFLTA